MSQDILVECICEAKYEVSSNLAAQAFTCEECGQELRIPTPEWDKRYRVALKKIEEGADPQRAQGYRDIYKIGTPASLPALQRGLYDPSREVVNTCLRALLVTRYGIELLLQLMEDSVLKMSRVVAMIRETRFEEGPDVLCNLIDAGRFNENQIMETISVLGEAGRERCIPTLKRLRKDFPNLAMLIDNALSNYREFDADVNKIPDDAKEIDSENVDNLVDFHGGSSEEEKRGCMPILIALAIPAALMILSVI